MPPILPTCSLHHRDTDIGALQGSLVNDAFSDSAPLGNAIWAQVELVGTDREPTRTNANPRAHDAFATKPLEGLFSQASSRAGVTPLCRTRGAPWLRRHPPDARLRGVPDFRSSRGRLAGSRTGA